MRPSEDTPLGSRVTRAAQADAWRPRGESSQGAQPPDGKGQLLRVCQQARCFGCSERSRYLIPAHEHCPERLPSEWGAWILG